MTVLPEPSTFHPHPEPQFEPVFVDDNSLFDDMPFLSCVLCDKADVTYDVALSRMVNLNRFNAFTSSPHDSCKCHSLHPEADYCDQLLL